jgi:hypothetical protein
MKKRYICDFYMLIYTHTHRNVKLKVNMKSKFHLKSILTKNIFDSISLIQYIA